MLTIIYAYKLNIAVFCGFSAQYLDAQAGKTIEDLFEVLIPLVIASAKVNRHRAGTQGRQFFLSDSTRVNKVTGNTKEVWIEAVYFVHDPGQKF